jgi:hypothetical protein
MENPEERHTHAIAFLQIHLTSLQIINIAERFRDFGRVTAVLDRPADRRELMGLDAAMGSHVQ